MNKPHLDYRIGVALGVLGFFLLIGLYAVEIPYFNRYLSFNQLMISGLLFGLLLGGGSAWYWGRQQVDPYDRMRLRLGLWLAGLLFGPMVFSLMNRHLDPWPAQVEMVEFFDLEDRYASRFGLPNSEERPEANRTHLYFYRNSELTRIIFNKKLDLSGLERGDLIGLHIRQGLFGVAWVRSVRGKAGGIDII